MTVLSPPTATASSDAIVEKNTAWWRVKLDGDDEATGIRKRTSGPATPAPGAPVPAPAPATAAHRRHHRLLPRRCPPARR